MSEPERALNQAACALATTLLKLASANEKFEELSEKFGVELERRLKDLVKAALKPSTD